MRAMIVLMLAAALRPVPAQVLYGSIVGTVTDPSGGVIQGATVSITHGGTGQARTTLTGRDGRYSLPNLAGGQYEIQISAPGFRPLTTAGAEVTINTVTRADASLEVGAVTEVITVSAEATRLRTDQGNLQYELGGRAIADLPLPRYRNYQHLIDLVPGTTPAAFQNAAVDVPARGLVTNVNGVNRNNNRTKIDGAVNVYIWLTHHTVYVPPAETIETVNISTSAFDAEQGMAGGAAITVATKSGTNDPHGSAFVFHDNSRFAAKNFFFTEARKPKSLVNIDGFTLGGPIIKNRLFYFGGWEGTGERVSRNGLFTVPNPDQRQGDFNAYRTVIYDPATGNPDGSGRTTFANNRIPLARQSAITRKLQEWIPLPNRPGESSANYFNSGVQELNRDNFDVKVNFNRSDRHAMWGKYSRMSAHVVGQPALGVAVGPCLCDGISGTGETLVQLAAIGHTMQLSPRFLWDGTISYTRMAQVALGPDYGKNLGSELLGIPGTNGSDMRQSGLPIFNIVGGYTALGVGGFPLFRNDDSYTITSNFSLTKGAHELRFGLEGIRHHLNHWQPEIGGGPRGSFSFGQGVTGLRGGTPTNQFNGWATFLLGLPSSLGKSIQFIKMTTYEYQWGWYIRDRWQVGRNLTVSLGIRHELYPMMTRAGYGGIEVWDPNTNLVHLGGIAGNPRDLGIGTSKKLLAPRAGVAWRANKSTVVRMGYGITYNPMVLSRPLRGFYPLTLAQTFEAINAFQPVQAIEKGIPELEIPDISSGAVPLPASAPMRTIAGQGLNRGYVQSWNFIIERRLPASFVTSVGYVGTQTVRSFGDLDVNAAAPDTGSNGRPFFARFRRTAETLFWNGFLSAHYHSLQATFQRPLSAGLMLQGNYTWSKAINMTDDDGWAGVMFNYLPHFSRNRAPAGYHIPHIFALGYAYELPFGRGKKMARNRVATALLSNWQLNGGFSAYLGRPFGVVAAPNTLNAPGNGQTADQIKPAVAKLGDLEQFYDRSAFAPPSGTPRFGNSGRNILRGPGVVNLSFSLFRDFPLTERLRLQFRAESFNFTNTPHFNNPSPSVNAGNFMRITSAAPDQRTIRFGLRLHF